MIGDDRIDSARGGIFNGFVSSDAGIAGEDQVYTTIEAALERRQVDTVALAEAIRHMIMYLRATLLQRGIEQRRRSLAVNIKVAPDQDALFVSYSPLQAIDGAVDIGQISR